MEKQEYFTLEDMQDDNGEKIRIVYEGTPKQQKELRRLAPVCFTMHLTVSPNEF